MRRRAWNWSSEGLNSFVAATTPGETVSKIWTPVPGLDIGVEVLYTNLDAPRFVNPVTGVVANTGNDDAWQGRLRIQRAL